MSMVNYHTAATLLVNGKVGVLRTDTLYGLVAGVNFPSAVERVYRLKKRQADKPCIILISKYSDIEELARPLAETERSWMDNNWPGKISLVLEAQEMARQHLHRGTRSLAFRLPAKDSLRELLDRTGPLIAPSANPESMKPAMTAEEAEDYFGTGVDFYVDEGRAESKPSTVIKLQEQGEYYLRN